MNENKQNSMLIVTARQQQNSMATVRRVGLSLLCSKFHLLCFLAFLQFSAHYARFYASLDCIMLAFLYADSSWIDVTEQDLCI